MQKKISFLTILLCMMVLSGCCLAHDWKDATCTEPRTCKVCGETEGEPLGHTWLDATCKLPKTCEVCLETEGEPLGHVWRAATCQSLRTCTVCGETEGDYADHDWVGATCLKPMHCLVCGITEGVTKPHVWVSANYNSSRYCSECGIVEGDSLVPAFEKRNYQFTIEKGTTWEYNTIANADNSSVKATAELIDYRKYKSDPYHPARDGYEWREATVKFTSNVGIKVMFGYTDTYAGLEEYPQSNYITYPDGTRLPVLAKEEFRYEWKDSAKENSTSSETNTAESQTDTTGSGAGEENSDKEGDTCYSYGNLAVQVPEDYDNLVFFVSNADYANTGRIDPNIKFMEMK